MLPLKLAILALFALDAALTVYAVRYYSAKLGEYFAPAKWAMAKLGPATGLITLKALCGAPMLLLYQADVTLWIAIVGYGAVALWNAYLIAKNTLAKYRSTS